MHIIAFVGIKEHANSQGVPDFELKIFRLQINNGKGKNYLIQPQAQLDLERASLIGSCGELNSEFLQNAGRFSHIFFLSWVVSSKFRGWVVLDLVGWSFRPIFRVSHFSIGRFGQSLKVIMHALLYVYGWTDGSGLSFVKKQAKMKKGPFRTRAETTLVKMPQAGPKRSVTVTV